MKHLRDSGDLASHRLNMGHSIRHLSNVDLSDPSVKISSFPIHHCHATEGSRIGTSAGEEDNMVSGLRDIICGGKIAGHNCKN